MGEDRTGPRPLAGGFVGRVAYDEAAALQERWREAVRRREEPEALLLLEHPHVYTLGRNARPGDVLADTGWLRARGVDVRATNRGGQVTYHGPGQLVGYPIVNLDPDRRDVRRYVQDLQEVLIRTLADYSLRGEAQVGRERIGVWVGERKVASIGVHLRRWITIHGFALNVTTDLSYFAGIVPCGLSGVSMASIESLTGERPPLDEVASKCLSHFARVFQRQLVPLAQSPWPGGRAPKATSHG